MPVVAYVRGAIAMLKLVSLIVTCFLLPATLFAQSSPAAEGRRAPSIWVGGEISMFNPDWGCKDSSPFTCVNHQLLGFAPFVDVDNLLLHRVGVEGEARILHWRGPGSGLTESTYLAGPRFGLVHFNNSLYLSGKVGFGNANIVVPNHAAGDGNHFAYAPGFIFEYRVSHRLDARAEYEYQIWPNFQGSTTCCGLTPNGFSLGFSYKVIR